MKTLIRLLCLIGITHGSIHAQCPIKSDVTALTTQCDMEKSYQVKINNEGYQITSIAWGQNVLNINNVSFSIVHSNSTFPLELSISNVQQSCNSKIILQESDFKSVQMGGNSARIKPMHMEQGVAFFDLMSASDVKHGDVDNDGQDGSLYTLDFFASESNAINNVNPLANIISSDHDTTIFVKISDSKNCSQLSKIRLLVTDICLKISESCDDGGLIPLIPLTCDPANPLALPTGGTFEIFLLNEMTNMFELRNDLLHCENDTCYIISELDGNYQVEYTFDDNGTETTGLALYDIQSVNPQLHSITQTTCSANEPFTIRANPKGGELLGEGIINNYSINSNQFFSIDPSLLIPDSSYLYKYVYNQQQDSELVCEKIDSIKIDVLKSPDVSIEIETTHICHGDDVLLHSVSTNYNGTNDLIYQWIDSTNTVISTDTDLTLNNVTVNSKIKVVITDELGCSAQDSIALTSQESPEISCEVTSSLPCFGESSGEILVTVMNALDLSKLTISWFDENDSLLSNSLSVPNLSSGNYRVEVKDSLDCESQCQVTIEAPDELVINCPSTAITQVMCHESTSGSIMFSASGGTPAYTFSLNNSAIQATGIFNNLAAGTYQLVVVDANDCESSCDFEINEPDSIEVEFEETISLECSDSNNGRITATVEGGKEPYSYIWSTGENTSIIENLGKGDYQLTITDANNCQFETEFELSAPEELQLSCPQSQIVDPTCFGEMDGEINVILSGGTTPYSSTINGVVSTALIKYKNLSAGQYEIVITDANMCSIQCAVNLGQPDDLSASIEINKPLNCNGDANGILEAKPTGGTAPYSYVWNTGATTAQITGVSSSTYAVTIQDASDCIASSSIILSEPDTLSVVIPQMEFCSDFMDTLHSIVNGGTEPYSYAWSTPGNITLNPSFINSAHVPVSTIGASGEAYVALFVIDDNNCTFTKIDTIDIESCYDLAIRKLLVGDPHRELGDTLQFTVEVFNQSTTAARNIIVEDRPEDGFIFHENINTSADNNNNHDWVNNNGLIQIEVDTLAPGESKVLYMNLEVDINTTKTILGNESEIIQSENRFVINPKDEDDLPPGIAGSVETDNTVDDDINGLEDDPLDEDKLDAAIVILCERLGDTTVMFDYCLPQDEEVCLDLSTPSLIANIDMDGDGDGDTNDGDTGVEVVGFYMNQTDAINNENPIQNICSTSSTIFWTRLDREGCLDVFSLPVHINTIPQVSIEGDLDVCRLEDGKFTAIGSPDYKYQWQVLLNGQFVDLSGETQLMLRLVDIDNALRSNPIRVQATDMTGDVSCSMVSETVQLSQILNNETLACNDLINVNLGEDCSHRVTPQQILEGESDNASIYQVSLSTQDGTPVNNPLTYDLVGEYIIAEVTNPCNNISCWGEIYVEHKTVATIICPDEITVSCVSDLQNIAELNMAIAEHCDPDLEVKLTNIKKLDYCSNINNTLYASRWEARYSAVNSDEREIISCNSIISLEPIDLSSITIANDTLECNDSSWDFNNNNYPDPEESGYPQINGMDLMTIESNCHIRSTFKDDILQKCGGSQFIIRTWFITEWCRSTSIELEQKIWVRDSKSPIITQKLEALTLTTSSDCLASYTVKKPEIIVEDCSNTNSQFFYAENPNFAQANYSLLSFRNQMTGDLLRLKEGEFIFKYIVTDACGNTSEIFQEVTTKDLREPSAICLSFISIALDEQGTAGLRTSSVDNGSSDNCGPLLMGLRRLGSSSCSSNTAPSLTLNGTSYFESIEFCCADLGSNHSVEFIVSDGSSNINFCRSTIEIQEQNTVNIKCQDDRVVACDTDIDPINYLPNIEGELACELSSIGHTIEGELSNCGEGTLFIDYYIIGTPNIKCRTNIAVENNNNFNLNTITVPSGGTINVDCSADLESNIPEQTVTLPEDACQSLAVTYADKVVAGTLSCTKVLRQWTLIDWCQYDHQLGTGIRTVTREYDVNMTGSLDIACQDIIVNSDAETCSAQVDLLPQVFSDCPINGEVHYQFNNLTGVAPFNRTLDVGSYSITWSIEDPCTGSAQCSQTIEIKDISAPLIYCQGTISTSFDHNSSREIWAGDFLNSIEDNCKELYVYFTGRRPLTFDSDHYFKYDGIAVTSATISDYFNGEAYFWDATIRQASFSYNCDNASSLTLVDITAEDLSGNMTSCTSELAISNYQNICGSQLNQIQGIVQAVQHDIEDVEFSLLNSEGQVIHTELHASGNYNMSNVENGAYLNLSKNDDLLLGVTSLDLVLINKHILAIETFTNPMHLVAADVNQDGLISSRDIVEIRKLILGIDNKFDNCDSYKFISKKDWDKNYPHDTRSNMPIDSEGYHDFYGVKMGDVSGVNEMYHLVERTNEGLLIGFDNSQNKINIKNEGQAQSNFEAIEIHLELDADISEILGLRLGDRALTLGSHYHMESIISNHSTLVNILLFEEELNSFSTSGIDVILGSGNKTPISNYNYSIISNDISNSSKSNVLALKNLGLYPNPIDEYVNVTIESTQIRMATYTITDTQGKVLLESETLLNAGVNRFGLDLSDICKQTGVYTFSIISGDEVNSQRMIKVD